MGDRAPFQAHIYACPDDQQAAALAVVEEYDLGPEFADDVTDGLNLAVPYFEAEMSLGSAQEIAAKLVEAAPGISFYLWEDPYEQYLGDMYAHTPDLGMFTAECDAEGRPVYNSDQIAKMIREAGIGRHADDLIAALGKAMGEPWFEDWRAHTPPAAAKEAGR